VFNPDVLVVTEAGTGCFPDCLELLRDEVRARSTVSEDAGQSVVASTFTGNVLEVAGGAVILDAVYANPLRQEPRPAKTGPEPDHGRARRARPVPVPALWFCPG
jgi:hypothetical protein